MTDFLVQIVRFFSPLAHDGSALPSRLMESAEARAGLDPRQAQELRSAACAALSVVR